MTTETYQVWADPAPPLMTAAELPTVAQQLSGPLGLPAAKILSQLQHPTSTDYVLLATGVSVANDQKIEALSAYNEGIYDNASYAMAYPNGEATANVVGFASVNRQTGVISGQAGVEQEYNKLLTGTTGSEEYEKDPNGEQIPGSLEETPAQNGDSIKLTINSVLQYDAMKACEAEVDKSQAKSCTAVIMQPKTGDILAMAQWPTWDQNTLNDAADATDMPDQWQFTPGSTAKVITAAAAFEHGGKTPMSSLPHPVPDLPGRAVDPRRGVLGERELHDRGHHRQLLQRRHVRGRRRASRRRPSTTTCATSASTSRPASACRARPRASSTRRRSGRPTSATRSPTARASRSTRSRWPASTRRSPTTASG